MSRDPDRPRLRRLPGGLTLRALAPNAITAGALCVGLTAIRFAIEGATVADPVLADPAWKLCVAAIILAGMLDGIDGRIARLLNAQSRFGAELDSLADSISFGVAPALILYLWSLQQLPRLGWFAALAFAICCVLRLARFNAQIDMVDEPRKQAGFLTGVPAPVGAGLAFLPMYLWIATGNDLFRDPRLVGGWVLLMAFLLISNLPTLSWSKLRPRRSIRIEVLALVGLLMAGLLAEPWVTLIGICAIYLMLLPVGIVAYARFRRRRADRPAEAAAEIH